MNWQDEVVKLLGRGIPLSSIDIIVALLFTLLCSIVCILMYDYFYGRENIGAGVHRSFLLLGPAITSLFLGIQFSLPLSLGLLGSLSIVRFRTPVKDPAEIGFIMMLIAGAIGSATFNYVLVGILFIVVFLALMGRRLISKPSMGGRGSLIVNLDGPDSAKLEGKLTLLITGKLRRARLDSISTSPDTTSLHYQFDKHTKFEWGAFAQELAHEATPIKVNLYIG